MLKKFKNEKGQAMVEFAIILPILMILVFGIIDFGWFFYNQASVNNSAREGARYAVVHTTLAIGETPQSRRAAIVNKILTVSPDTIKTDMVITIEYFDKNNVKITDETKIADILLGDIKIKVTSNVKILTPLFGIFTKNQKKAISATVTMKVES